MSADPCLVDKYKRAIYYIDLPILQKDHGDADVYKRQGVDQ